MKKHFTRVVALVLCLLLGVDPRLCNATVTKPTLSPILATVDYRIQQEALAESSRVFEQAAARLHQFIRPTMFSLAQQAGTFLKLAYLQIPWAFLNPRVADRRITSIVALAAVMAAGWVWSDPIGLSSLGLHAASLGSFGILPVSSPLIPSEPSWVETNTPELEDKIILNVTEDMELSDELLRQLEERLRGNELATADLIAQTKLQAAAATSASGRGPLLRNRIVEQASGGANVIGVSLLRPTAIVQEVLDHVSEFPLEMYDGNAVTVQLWRAPNGSYGQGVMYFLDVPGLTDAEQRRWVLGRGALKAMAEIGKNPDVIVMDGTSAVFAHPRLIRDRYAARLQDAITVFNDQTAQPSDYNYWDVNTLQRLGVNPGLYESLEEELGHRDSPDQATKFDVKILLTDISDGVVIDSDQQRRAMSAMLQLVALREKVSVAQTPEELLRFYNGLIRASEEKSQAYQQGARLAAAALGYRGFTAEMARAILTVLNRSEMPPFVWKYISGGRDEKILRQGRPGLQGLSKDFQALRDLRTLMERSLLFHGSGGRADIPNHVIKEIPADVKDLSTSVVALGRIRQEMAQAVDLLESLLLSYKAIGFIEHLHKCLTAETLLPVGEAVQDATGMDASLNKDGTAIQMHDQKIPGGRKEFRLPESVVKANGRRKGPILSPRVSPDGRWLAAICADGIAWIWDYETGQIRHGCRPADGQFAYRLAFSPNSRTLAVACDVHENNSLNVGIQFFDVETGELHPKSLHADTGRRVEGMTFSPHGDKIAGYAYNTAVVWYISAFDEDGIVEPSLEPMKIPAGYFTRLYFRPNNTVLVLEVGPGQRPDLLWKVRKTIMRKPVEKPSTLRTSA